MITALNLFLAEGNDLRPIQPELIYALTDSDGYVRALSMYTLAVMCPNRRAAWTAFIGNTTGKGIQVPATPRDPRTPSLAAPG